MLTAMIEAAEVLTPEQRAKLIERRQRRMQPPR
jgi:Spy/CpxP family protein refolding chaperone